jgi:hypothetical protein
MAWHTKQYSTMMRTEEGEQTLEHSTGDYACVLPIDYGSSLLYQSGQVLQ